MNARLSSVKTHADFYYFKRGPKIFRVKPGPAMKSFRVEQEYDFIIDVPEHGTFNAIGGHWLTNIRGFREISNPDLTTDKIKGKYRNYIFIYSLDPLIIIAHVLNSTDF
jgi:hypothetical protein